MSLNFRKIGLLIVLGAVLLSACGPQNAEPTVNPDSIYTAAAMTVAAQLTEAAALNPTSTVTVIPPTQTPPVPTLQVSTVEGTQGTAGQPLATSTLLVLATLAASPPPPAAQAKYEISGQSPADSAVFAPGTRFDMNWTIKNTGTETWTEQYSIEFFIGDRIGGGRYTITKYNFKKAVAPGESITLIVDMQAPAVAGEYFSWWKLKNEIGANFGDVDVTIVVPGGPTATATP
jgi:hypothetical protein